MCSVQFAVWYFLFYKNSISAETVSWSSEIPLCKWLQSTKIFYIRWLASVKRANTMFQEYSSPPLLLLLPSSSPLPPHPPLPPSSSSPPPPILSSSTVELDSNYGRDSLVLLLAQQVKQCLIRTIDVSWSGAQ